jgi:hypothetical protein
MRRLSVIAAVFLYSFELSGSVEINEIKNNSGSIGIYGDE